MELQTEQDICQCHFKSILFDCMHGFDILESEGEGEDEDEDEDGDENESEGEVEGKGG